MAAPTLKVTDVITVPARLSFPALFEMKATSKDKDAKKAYYCSLLLPPDTDLAPFRKAMAAAWIAKFGKDLKPKADKNPLKDCATKGHLAGYTAGWHFITAKTQYQPVVVDQRRQPIIDQRVIYAGCWVRAHVNAFAYDHQVGGKGISFGLNAVQFVKDGERLDGRVNAEQIFDAIEIQDEGDVFDGAETGSKPDDAAELFGG